MFKTTPLLLPGQSIDNIIPSEI